MKKLLALLITGMSLVACQDHPAEHKEKTGPSGEVQHQHEEKGKELQLNNGKKWTSDASTDQNVAALDSIASGFQKRNRKALEDYHDFAGSFQEGLDKMINECRMKGADHDALHLWLEPILSNTGELKKATTVEKAEELTAAIRSRLHQYPEYFEQS